MKIRNGFVSNSSSSSFIIGVKNSTLKEKLDSFRTDVLDKFTYFPFIVVYSDIIQYILSNAKELDVKQYIDEYCDEDDKTDFLLSKPHLTDDNFTWYEITVGNYDENMIGQYLYENEDALIYDSGEFIINYK